METYVKRGFDPFGAQGGWFHGGHDDVWWPQVPPWGALVFEDVTLQFWMSQLSLSPVNASQPLTHALEVLNRTLTPVVWAPPCVSPPVSPEGNSDESTLSVREMPQRADHPDELSSVLHGASAAADKFIEIVDALLSPPEPDPKTGGWSEDDASFLLTQAAKACSKVGCLIIRAAHHSFSWPTMADLLWDYMWQHGLARLRRASCKWGTTEVGSDAD
jgi:hypothetical protein